VGTVVDPNTFVGKFLEWSPLSWIGRLSYSIYLWQQPFFADNEGTLASRMYTFPLRFGLVLGCACISYYCLERPSIRFGCRLYAKTFSEKRTAEPPEMAATVH
jgi:peptidoglycan/LPS O-acetylase OafA/YrhL